jgi:hypothetical protein
MRPDHLASARSTRHFALLVLVLGLPRTGAAQQPELLWSFDTKG